jgi:hypothetical protein
VPDVPNRGNNPSRLIQSRRILGGSVSFAKRVFDKRDSKAQEVRIHIYFPQASAAGVGNVRPISMAHALGKVPTQWDVVSVQRDPAAGPPGVVYVVHPFASSSRATFLCTTAQTWAEIVLR